MNKHYIVINLNKAESAETRLARIREQVRWGIFGVLMLLLISVNFQVWMISNGYNDIISQKKEEIYPRVISFLLLILNRTAFSGLRSWRKWAG